MCGPPGIAYVYLVYGMYDCLNVVTEPGRRRRAPCSIRAVEPLDGHRRMRADRLAVRRRRRARARRWAAPHAARRGSTRVPDARLASGPGWSAAAFGVDRDLDRRSTCAIRRRPLRLERDPADAADRRAGDRDRGRPAGRRRPTPARPGRDRPWRFAIAGHPSVSRRSLRAADARPMDRDARSQALLEFPLVRERLAAATSFPPSRRLAEALEPSADPVVVARRLDETDQARALLEERPGVGIGAAHDIGPSVERAARGGRLDPAQFLEIAETLDATRRLATSLADERRPLLRDLGRELHALPALRSHARPQLRSGRGAARHRLAAAGRAARGRPRRLRPPAAAARRARRRRARHARSRSPS